MSSLTGRRQLGLPCFAPQAPMVEGMPGGGPRIIPIDGGRGRVRWVRVQWRTVSRLPVGGFQKHGFLGSIGAQERKSQSPR